MGLKHTKSMKVYHPEIIAILSTIALQSLLCRKMELLKLSSKAKRNLLLRSALEMERILHPQKVTALILNIDVEQDWNISVSFFFVFHWIFLFFLASTTSYESTTPDFEQGLSFIYIWGSSNL